MAGSEVYKPAAKECLPLFGSLAGSGAFLLFLCWYFEPSWETNDDVGMSMYAHGYGAAAQGSSNLLFSNVVWGHLVRSIPEINGILGYSSATLIALFVAGSVLIYGLCRLNAGPVACLSAFALIMARPVLFPQFTVNAGLLLVGAVICWHLYARQNGLKALIIGCLLAYFSYLVRSSEFLLVLIVAAPLLPWQALLLRQPAKIAMIALAAAIAFSAIIDNKAYQRDEWKIFNELNQVRVSYNDFGADEHLKRRPDILNRYGFSVNDIDLIHSWFFADPKIADPEALRAMLSELGSLSAQKNDIAKGGQGIEALWHPNVLPVFLTALLLALLRPNRRLAAGWGLCITAVFILGLMGRPGVMRVYIPLASLLIVAPFLTGSFSAGRRGISAAALLAAAAVNASVVFSQSNRFQESAEQIRRDLAGFPREAVITWGGVFPYEAVYPVLGAVSAMPYRLYGLGASMLAPFSVASAEGKKGRGLIDLLLSDTGVPLIANAQRFGYLAAYCKERHKGRLKELSVRQFGAVTVSRRRCEASP